MRKAPEFEHDVAVMPRKTQRVGRQCLMFRRRFIVQFAEQRDGRVLIDARLGMFEGQIEERPLVEFQFLILTHLDAVTCGAQCQGIGCECTPRTSMDLSGELVRHDNEREAAARIGKPRRQMSGRSFGEQVTEAVGDVLIECGVSGEPTLALRRARKTRSQRAEPEVE